MSGQSSVLIVLAVLSATASAALPFVWSDCSSDKAHNALVVHSIEVSPVPLAIPGDLHLTFNATVLKPIQVAMMDFKFVRKTALGTDVPIACVGNVGSCTFDGCSILNDLGQIGSQSTAQNVTSQISTMFNNAGANIACPIQPQSIVVRDFVFHIPRLSSAMDIFATGDYNVTVQLREPATDAQLGCLTFDASLVKPSPTCSGWLCSGRRKRHVAP
ncbi:uncharacterized protein LOC132543133 [Ylistrum balloti]|uniref:uncharacterized protein LOC132543133 n=1 Tax=Ylistrum balloti TaxID=509963 RepID=UPI002905B507|nr:uncharacterized protein LOC132543133 [Ylistrum balloti]